MSAERGFWLVHLFYTDTGNVKYASTCNINYVSVNK